MKITKYEHSCLVLEDQGKRLIIDPGDFSKTLPPITAVVGFVITHVHFDHFNKDRLLSILSSNPEAKIYSVSAVQEQIPETIVSTPGGSVAVGPFSIEFFGGEHAIIHSDYPKFENLGVLVNGKLYYGGDSLVVPSKPVELLAVPVSGPWSKTSETLDYFAEIKPQLAIPVHDALNSEAGNESQDRWFQLHAEKRGLRYQRLKVGESIEV